MSPSSFLNRHLLPIAHCTYGFQCGGCSSGSVMQHAPAHDAGCHTAGSLKNYWIFQSSLAFSRVYFPNTWQQLSACTPKDLSGLCVQAPFLDVLGTMTDPSLPLTLEDREEWGDPVGNPQHKLSISSYCPLYNITPQVRRMTLLNVSDRLWKHTITAMHSIDVLFMFLYMNLSALPIHSADSLQGWFQNSSGRCSQIQSDFKECNQCIFYHKVKIR